MCVSTCNKTIPGHEKIPKYIFKYKFILGLLADVWLNFTKGKRKTSVYDREEMIIYTGMSFT